MESNVAELLSRAAAQEPDKTALSEAATGRTVTWSGLDDLVDRVVQGLSDAGMVAGYRVMIATGNSIEFVAAYLGALRAGMVVVPVNPRSATGELIRMIADSGTRMVIADADTISTVREAVGGLDEALEAGGHGAGRAAAHRHRRHHPRAGRARLGPAGRHARAGRRPARVDPETLAVLLYTSGTSGRPRAAMLSHRALLANIEQVAQVDPPMITGRDVVLGVLPLFHVYGLNAVLGQVLRQQRAARARRRLRPRGLARPHRGRGDLRGAGGAAGLRLLDAGARASRTGSVRCGWCSAARRRSSPELTDAFTERTGVEHPPGLRPDRGRAGGHLDAVQQGPHAAVGGRGAARASRSGWSTRPAASRTTRTAARSTSAATTCSPATGPTAPTAPTREGWWATGDVGYLDPSGDLYLVDRVKELVIVSGFNVYPSEVEDVIAELPEVAEAAVIGVEDAETGEAVVAYVKPTAGRGERRPRRRRTPPLRGAAGPVQAAVGDPRRRRAALHGHRQGPEGPAARHRAPPRPGPAGVST